MIHAFSRSFSSEVTRQTLAPPENGVEHRGGWLIGLGIFMMVIGAFAIMNFIAATIASIYVLGTLLVLSGIVFAGGAFVARQWNIALLDVLAAALYIISGIFALREPAAAATGLSLMLGVLFLVQGVVRILGALAMTPSHWGWVLVSGLASVILGGMILAQWPFSGLWVLGTLVGVDLIAGGSAMLSLGLMIQRASHPPSRPLATLSR